MDIGRKAPLKIELQGVVRQQAVKGDAAKYFWKVTCPKLRPTSPFDGSDHSVSGDCDDSEQNEREAYREGKGLIT